MAEISNGLGWSWPDNSDSQGDAGQITVSVVMVSTKWKSEGAIVVVPGGRRSHQVLLVVSPGCYVYTHHIFHGRKLLRQRFILSGDMLLTATELDIDEKNERQT